MAQSGTIVAMRDQYRSMLITILGVTLNNTSPVFHSFGYPIGSFVMEGTLGVGGSAQLQGSNDGGTTWTNVGTATTTIGGSGSFVGNNNEVFQLYQFSVTAGDGTTSLNFYIFLSATFG